MFQFLSNKVNQNNFNLDIEIQANQTNENS